MRVLSEKDNPEYVRVEECRQRHAKIELALFGPDGRGGMVKDIGDIKNTLNDQKQERELSRKWKATIYGTVITTTGLIIVKIIEVIGSLL